MNLLIAPDSFKGCLTSEDVCACIARGAIIADPDIRIKQIPSSDGGEGFCSSMINLFGGEWISREVTFPLGNKGVAQFVFNASEKNAYIELASAAGLQLVEENQRDIMNSTTFGVGELILYAVELGSEKIVIGLGGSATNDGGIGILSALGMRFFDRDGNDLPPIASSLSKVKFIDKSRMIDLSRVSLVAACDVKNPLCGQRGAARVFAKQKGAADEEINLLDEALLSYAEALNIDPNVKGSGAAGGVGAALLSVLGAEFVSGAELLVRSGAFSKALDFADIVITGEGNTDEQTLYGKLVSVIASAAVDKNVLVIVLSGGLSYGYEKLYDLGVSRICSLSEMGYEVDYCIKNAKTLLTDRTVGIIQEFKKSNAY